MISNYRTVLLSALALIAITLMTTRASKHFFAPPRSIASTEQTQENPYFKRFQKLKSLPLHSNKIKYLYEKIGLRVSDNVPQPVFESLIEDLEFLSQLRLSKSSPLYQGFFGESDLAIFKWFLERVKVIGYDYFNCNFPIFWDSAALACVIRAEPITPKSTLFLTANYFKESSKVVRLGILLHEAQHLDPNALHPHTYCKGFEPSLLPTDSLNYLPNTDFLIGKPACDEDPKGSYVAQVVLLYNWMQFCTTCSPNDLNTLASEYKSLVARIENIPLRRQLLNDQTFLLGNYERALKFTESGDIDSFKSTLDTISLTENETKTLALKMVVLGKTNFLKIFAEHQHLDFSKIDWKYDSGTLPIQQGIHQWVFESNFSLLSFLIEHGALLTQPDSANTDGCTFFTQIYKNRNRLSKKARDNTEALKAEYMKDCKT